MTRKEKNLLLAAVEGDVRRIERLLAPNIDPALIFFNGWSLLHIAAHYNQRDLAQWLLERNVGVDTLNMHRATPLHICAYSGSSNVADLLVDSRARIDLADSNGWIPLGIAAWHGYTTIVSRLISGGCDISQRGNGGQTAMHYAAWNNYTDIVQLFMDSGGNTVIGNDDGFTPVDLAWQNQSLESLRIMAPQKYEALLDHMQKVWGTHSSSIVPRRISQETLDFVQSAMLETDQENHLSSSRKKRTHTYNHISTSGVAVASRSEVVIANMLHSIPIPFDYKGDSANQNILRQVRPSFLFKIRGGTEIAWDHVERQQQEDFDGYLAQRIQRFVNAGFRLGEDYLISFDNAEGAFDSTRMRNYINLIRHRIRIAEVRHQLRTDSKGVNSSESSKVIKQSTSADEQSFVEEKEPSTGSYPIASSISGQILGASSQTGGKAPLAPGAIAPPAALSPSDPEAEVSEAEIIPAEHDDNAAVEAFTTSAIPPNANGNDSSASGGSMPRGLNAPINHVPF